MNNAGLYLYLKQQDINHFLLEQTSNITLFNFSIIFIGGLLTSLSPCMLYCLPMSISYIHQAKNKFLNGLLFISGTLTSIISIGFLGVIIKKSYTILPNIITMINPIIILIIGLSLLNIIELNAYQRSESTNKTTSFKTSIQAYILGISIGFNISPCTTPILMSLIAWITNTQKILIGGIFLLIYAIGYIIPIILCLISLNNIKKMDLVKPLWENLLPFTGSLVIATGSFSLFHEIFAKIAF